MLQNHFFQMKGLVSLALTFTKDQQENQRALFSPIDNKRSLRD
jgi:hypothetical protein